MDGKRGRFIFLLFATLTPLTPAMEINHDNPKFSSPIINVTVPVGREAVIECRIENLSAFKVAWLRVDTQTILTIHSHVITKNHRIAVRHSEHKTWYLHIRDVREYDRGWYMCQINTDPMMSQVGYLDVVVPPDIVDFDTSADMVVREGSNVTFKCSATGSPKPTITWRREGGEPITLLSGQEAPSFEGSVFDLTKVNRLHMGPYLCIASNGIPPSVSKRIMLIVHFPPMIWIQNQLVGAYEGEMVTLECHSEAYPKSINYWTRESGSIISQGTKYVPTMVDNTYKVHMKLIIRSVGPTDYGSYNCVSKNSLGDTDGTIKLYQIPAPSTTTSALTTTATSTHKPTLKDTLRKRTRQRENTSIVETNGPYAPESVKEQDLRLHSGLGEANRQEVDALNAYPSASRKNIPLFESVLIYSAVVLLSKM